MSGDSEYRARLVVLGGGGVGKTAIVKRFLFNTFCEKHQPTVEDLHYREFDLGTMTLKVDLLDTAGDLQFPAMRRLSIANAQAFLIVYSIEKSSSFDTMKQCFEEIREQREDFQEIPMMFVGNKSDLSPENREILKEDVAEWIFCDLPRLRTKLMECSAKDNVNIKELFKGFLQLAKIPLPSDTRLRRRSSAHASGGKSKLLTTLSPNMETLEGAEGHRAKPRSRSLIRRSSKKASAKLKEEAPYEPDDCMMS
ncbi:GTP-binding protein Di-Ras2-like [Limulus polyphemus]|uniref:GTP-binding protein Di-Ras2-like n=1 Tax=Limulus polyphemus TaxID=6850 RepID=A0ABM1TPC1_LIMPO|nr:GTP-binding protein Di-Ras2-like [Limulus polyphemus]XP_022257721.1 GTP-binding protein Di-Ras2-like [Limulus polyphemus]XP_022257722.1 GTP-binding protein Di-Ras2-like [Limulus polyphemus]XP_022257724.1 GTP-binding protein Di-Ras2-like [Limulus polyphemus]XP_022257725.1 GTP-binding protein Di-Ras2-like [Limulus polyphemus]XP_022257726.1 GTP-binding protein Di-Ras2-like [Limulus polyphemus]XP_022257727.1 GTP-binding protein Di-Ras2-like [Limulus polyphemus]